MEGEIKNGRGEDEICGWGKTGIMKTGGELRKAIGRLIGANVCIGD